MSEREMISRSHPENEAIRRETVKWQQRENDALRAENEKLREALKPFATAGRHFVDDGRKTLVVTIGVDIGDLQAAAAAIRETDAP